MNNILFKSVRIEKGLYGTMVNENINKHGFHLVRFNLISRFGFIKVKEVITSYTEISNMVDKYQSKSYKYILVEKI